MKNNKIIILLCLLALSCNEKTKSSIDITGNWYIFSNSKNDNKFYAETYISDERMYFFNEHSGLSHEFKYKIETDSLFLISTDDSEKANNGYIKIIDENTFSKMNDGRFLIFKRVKEGITLEDYLLNRNDNYILDFNKRMRNWYKK